MGTDLPPLSTVIGDRSRRVESVLIRSAPPGELDVGARVAHRVRILSASWPRCQRGSAVILPTGGGSRRHSTRISQEPVRGAFCRPGGLEPSHSLPLRTCPKRI